MTAECYALCAVGVLAIPVIIAVARYFSSTRCASAAGEDVLPVLAERARAAEAAIRNAFAKAEAFDTYVSLNFVDELGEPLDAASAYEILRTSILDDHAIAARARAELAAVREKHGGVKREFLADPAATLLATLKRIIDGEE